MTTEKGRSLELFFVDGLPEGVLTARMFNWTGHILVAPRTQLPEALRHAEARNTGVYLLLRNYSEFEQIDARASLADIQANRHTGNGGQGVFNGSSRIGRESHMQSRA